MSLKMFPRKRTKQQMLSPLFVGISAAVMWLLLTTLVNLGQDKDTSLANIRIVIETPKPSLCRSCKVTG